MRTYKTHAGENIAHAADEMVKLANFSGEPVTATFNDIPIDTAPGGNADDIVRNYSEAREECRVAYLKSTEYAESQRRRTLEQEMSKYTRWFQPNVTPVHIGVYQRHYGSIVGPLYNYWDGESWCAAESSINAARLKRWPSGILKPWRGLARKPK